MFELRIVCPEGAVDTLCDALEALDALSVSVEDADAHSELERPLFGEPGMPAPKEGWNRSIVLALYQIENSATESVAILRAQDFFSDCEVIGISQIPEQDWVRLTQSQFEPVEITPEFWIVPTWHEPPAAAVQMIRLDPGLAFGTGTHPTTRMCLRWIAHAVRPGWGRVLDYGCGSGILAIACAKFGAQVVDAVDIDPAAVESTRSNAQANSVHINSGLVDQLSDVYQLVLANILATPLKVLAPLLWSRVAPGGDLVLAGILERQEQELKAAYAPYCELVVTDTQDGWILMTASKSNS